MVTNHDHRFLSSLIGTKIEWQSHSILHKVTKSKSDHVIKDIKMNERQQRILHVHNLMIFGDPPHSMTKEPK